MGRYIVLYSAPISVKQRFAQATPEEAMAGMHMWIDWAKKLGKSLLDPGRPFGRAIKVTAAGTAPSDSPIVGMSILEASGWTRPWRWSKTTTTCTGRPIAKSPCSRKWRSPKCRARPRRTEGWASDVDAALAPCL